MLNLADKINPTRTDTLINDINAYESGEFEFDGFQKSICAMLVEDGVITLKPQFYIDNIHQFDDYLDLERIIPRVDEKTFEQIFHNIKTPLTVIPLDADPNFVVKNFINEKFNKRILINRGKLIPPQVLELLLPDMDDYDLLNQLSDSLFSDKQIEHFVYHATDIVKNIDPEELWRFILEYQNCTQEIIDFIVEQKPSFISYAVQNNHLSEEFLEKHFDKIDPYDIIVYQSISSDFYEKHQSVLGDDGNDKRIFAKQKFEDEFYANQTDNAFNFLEKLHILGELYSLYQLRNSDNYNIVPYGKQGFYECEKDDILKLLTFSQIVQPVSQFNKRYYLSKKVEEIINKHSKELKK